MTIDLIITEDEADITDDEISFDQNRARVTNIEQDDAFILAMARAVKRGREKVRPGTFVDKSSPIGAIRNASYFLDNSTH